MAFCANCGAAVNDGGGFCGSCGKAVGNAGPALVGSAPAVSAGSGTAAAPASAALAAPGLTPNVAAALSYILGFITGIIFLVVDPYKSDRFVRFHAMQSIFFSVACIALSIAWSIAVNILISISGWTAVALTPIGLIISLGLFLLWLFLMYQAYNRREFRIPVIGALAAKQVG